jgi:N utilization substance protein B
VPLYIELPTSVVLEITYTEPGLQGDRSTGGNKPATVQTGATVMVPLFIVTRREDQGGHPRRALPWSRLTAHARRPFNPSRRKSRRRALDVLYSADLRDEPTAGVLADTLRRMGSEVPDHMAYAVELVEGVTANADRIDELIASYAEGWTLDRMPVVDRNLGRIGVYEIVFRDDIDDAVALSEVVELADELSTDGSARFLNGCSTASASTPPADVPSPPAPLVPMIHTTART